jgi:hypothetical protein
VNEITLVNEGIYTVTFVDSYAILMTTVSAMNRDQAIFRGVELMSSYYGLDVSKWRVEDIFTIEEPS